MSERQTMPTARKTTHETTTTGAGSSTPAAETTLPAGWRMVRFGEMAMNISDRVDNPSEAGVKYYVGLEHLDPESLRISRWGVPTDVEATKLRFRSGDIIFGRRRAYQRKLAVADFEGICSAHAMVLRAKPEVVLPEFLPFLMQSDMFFDRAMAISVGSLSPTINWKTLDVQQFPLPPLDEQRRIAELIWAADETLELYQRVVSTQKALKQSLLKQFFENPSLTKFTSLGSVGNWLSGGTPSRSNNSYWNGDIPWASPKDMKVDSLGSTEEKITVEGSRKGTRLVPAETIFIVVRGMILAHTFPISITSREMAFNQDIKALICNSMFNSKYILYWFQYKSSDILGITSNSSHGTKRIPTDSLFSMKVPIINIDNQHNIVNILSKIDRSIEQSIIHCAITKKLKQRLLKNSFLIN